MTKRRRISKRTSAKLTRYFQSSWVFRVALAGAQTNISLKAMTRYMSEAATAVNQMSKGLHELGLKAWMDDLEKKL